MKTNREITASQVRLIGKNGGQVGVVQLSQALLQAEQEGLDLVEIAPKSVPPVCKIIDYGKYRYQVTKKQREKRKGQGRVKLKEVKFKPNIDHHDLQVKVKHAQEFLEKGNKVRLTCAFRGRELSHPEIGEKMLEEVVSALSPIARTETPRKLIGRSLTLVLAPSRNKSALRKEE